jgi:hypothetical protein
MQLISVPPPSCLASLRCPSTIQRPSRALSRDVTTVHGPGSAPSKAVDSPLRGSAATAKVIRSSANSTQWTMTMATSETPANATSRTATRRIVCSVSMPLFPLSLIFIRIVSARNPLLCALIKRKRSCCAASRLACCSHTPCLSVSFSPCAYVYSGFNGMFKTSAIPIHIRLTCDASSSRFVGLSSPLPPPPIVIGSEFVDASRRIFSSVRAAVPSVSDADCSMASSASAASTSVIPAVTSAQDKASSDGDVLMHIAEDAPSVLPATADKAPAPVTQSRGGGGAAAAAGTASSSRASKLAKAATPSPVCLPLPPPPSSSVQSPSAALSAPSSPSSASSLSFGFGPKRVVPVLSLSSAFGHLLNKNAVPRRQRSRAPAHRQTSQRGIAQTRQEREGWQ